MFLAFFPALVFLAGVFVASARLTPGLEDLLVGLETVLPPGSWRAVMSSLGQLSAKPVQLLVGGLLGTVLVGSQFTLSLNRAFGAIYGRSEGRSFWRRQLLATWTVLVTVGPWVVVTLLVMFGRQTRAWLLAVLGGEYSVAIRLAGTAGYYAIVSITAVLILGTLYYALVPNHSHRWHQVLPGAVLAMGLWWLVTSAFGFYVRKLAVYSLLYGGFAATIGLLVWMYLSAVVVLIGAQFNVELQRPASASAAAAAAPRASRPGPPA